MGGGERLSVCVCVYKVVSVKRNNWIHLPNAIPLLLPTHNLTPSTHSPEPVRSPIKRPPLPSMPLPAQYHHHPSHHAHYHHHMEPVLKTPPKRACRRPDKPPMQCANCGVMDTPLWRKASDGSGVTLCNACGIYLKTHSVCVLFWVGGLS